MAYSLPQPTTSRTIVRGTLAIFDTAFLEQDGSPLVPIDAALYPVVSITDTDGVVVDTGVAVALGDGRWRFQSVLPADAVLSTDDSPWRIEWVMTTVNGRTASVAQNFNVIDVAELTPTDRAYTNMIAVGCTERLMVKFRANQAYVGLRLIDSGGGSIDLSGSVQRSNVDGWYVYYADTGPWTALGDYLATWTMRQAQNSPTQVIVQKLRVPPLEFWMHQSSLRMLIDKVQKKSGSVYAYSDSDMYEYMLRGADIINQTNPVSHWTMPMVANTSPLFTYWIIASAWYGLRAQYLTGEIDFSFSGQTVTLDNDNRSAIYESSISSFNDFLVNSTTTLQQTKKNLLRQSHTGVAGVRPISWRQGPYVAQVGGGRGGGNSVFSSIPLAVLGLSA